jgi:biopolymer transport protein ExbD
MIGLGFVAVAVLGCIRENMKSKDGGQSIMLPIARHGEPLTENVMRSRHVFMELSIADSSGAMYSIPTVTVQRTLFPLRGSEGGIWREDALRRKLREVSDDDISKDLRCYIKADARCKFKGFSDLVNQCNSSGLWRLFAVAGNSAANQTNDATQLLAFEFLWPCPCFSEEEANEPCLIELELCEDDVCEFEDNDESDYAIGSRLQIYIGPSADGSDDGIVVWRRKRVSLEELDSAFGEMSGNPAISGKGICMKCFEDSPYKTFVKVLDVLYKHGFKRVYVFTL